MEDAPLGGLLQRYRDAEAGWLKEKGKLMLAADGEKKRRLKAEAELRRVQQQLSFRVGEVQHLKTGLRSRDCELQDLRDRLREYELAEGGERTAQEAVAQAQAERDELRAAMAEVLQRLDAANDVIGRADSSMASLEAQLAAATAERQRAEDAERAAQAEAQQLREAVADMQWKCGLLQRLSDLTMQQNEEKTATLQTLLESESMLDGDGEAAGGGGTMTADGHDPTAVHEDPASPTYGEKQDVLSDLPAGITSVQLGGAGGSGFYAFGAQMPNPFQERAADPFSARPSVDIRRSVDGRISVDFRRSIDARGKTDIDRGVSGVIVHDLLHLTSDPRVKQRLMEADADNDGRISRKDILKVMHSEMSAKQRLKWGLISGGILLVFCLLMLAANAALTYTVVRMSQETTVQSSGVMTDKAGNNIIGTASTAGVVDLLYAHYSPAEASAALLSLKSLVITAGNGTAVSVYQVLAATLVPGQRLDFVVTAPAAAAAGASANAADLMRIVIDDAGVHEVRSGAQQAGRRLLVAATTAGAAKTVQGLVYDVTAPTCSTGSCGGAASQISCPEVPTCGANGKLYISPCAAIAAGTTVRCTNCAPMCTGNNSGGLPRPGGLPGNLAVDGGSNYVRTSPPPPSPANSGGNVAAAGAKPTQTQPVKKAASVRRPQNTRKNPPPAKAP
ncbi:hypothetical protein CHLNCDRAFT_140571 [Chlorella variabilis]|uniref:EF-hand domain-containing protein n=1 Tax=Chlorella variabilis TaxID=554065 RepID=E1Z5P7_CHLVA|nr:hypothetical protein CHLNCDRAFT_140571 [Chlorella variabilis]EFN58511.1 hypothetical protein CHLNCDRAFT_140571 [Chlorella variabilis]|eukprot:XP_005850613.1 hypothetical protein CHLNCDRAFT_140571 [Chlorella variabilis]